MKKYLLIIPIFLIALSTSVFAASAAFINGVDYQTHSYELYQTHNEENYYNVRFYHVEGSFLMNMTTWYNTLDNIHAVDHVYSFQYPIIFIDDTIVVADGIHTVYIDYDLASASASNIYLLDNGNNMVGSISMSELTSSMKFIMIRSAMLDPYAQGYEDGAAHKTSELNNMYRNIIQTMQNNYLNDISILESEVTSLENEISILNGLLVDAENEFFDLGYDEAIEFAHTYGFNTFASYIDENSYSYLKGHIDGINEGSDLNIGIRGFVPSLLGSIGAFFLTLGAIEFMGVSINGLIAFLAILIGIIFVLKLIYGGGD